jgi:hypothetical protein
VVGHNLLAEHCVRPIPAGRPPPDLDARRLPVASGSGDGRDRARGRRGPGLRPERGRPLPPEQLRGEGGLPRPARRDRSLACLPQRSLRRQRRLDRRGPGSLRHHRHLGQQQTGGGRLGVIRVGPVTGGEPHLLFGPPLQVWALAVSPDGGTIAAAMEDGTIQLWPMPDVAEPPLHTLPLDELLARLGASTNAPPRARRRHPRGVPGRVAADHPMANAPPTTDGEIASPVHSVGARALRMGATFTFAELSGAAGERLGDSIEAVPEFGLAALKLEAPVEPQGD